MKKKRIAAITAAALLAALSAVAIACSNPSGGDGGPVDTSVITTVAGNGTYGSGGDGGPATSAQFEAPIGVAVDASGNVYVADCNSNHIRKIDAATGVITTVAGTGFGGTTGDGGPATSAGLAGPLDLAFDASGNLYVATPNGGHCIRMIDAAGNISTVAGTGTGGFGGDGGAATSASLFWPSGVAVDASGNLYVADGANQRIRKIDDSTQYISTVAGNPTWNSGGWEGGFSGDGGAATSARLDGPCGLAFDASGSLYVADTYNHRIRKIDAATGKIATIAGNPSWGDTEGWGYNHWEGGFGGDGGPAASAQLSYPYDVAVDASGNVYVADTGNSRIRKITF